MPKIDPDTGCQVLTTGEFFELEAQRDPQGRTAGELLGAFMDEINQAENDERNRLKDPAVAIMILQQAAISEAEEWFAAWIDPIGERRKYLQDDEDMGCPNYRSKEQFDAWLACAKADLQKLEYLPPPNFTTYLAKTEYGYRPQLEYTPTPPRPPFPMEIIGEVEVGYGITHTTEHTRITAVVRCDDGKERKMTYNRFFDGGNYMEPSSDESSLDWED